MLGSLFGADQSIDAYVLVYDITSTISLENLGHFAELVEKNLESGIRPADAPEPVKIVLGNKCDLAESRVISSQEGLNWAKSRGCGFMETSAKAMVNIEETFQIVIRQVVANRKKALEDKEQEKREVAAKPSRRVSRPNLRQALSAANLRKKERSKTDGKKRGCCVIS
jgi:GTPase SAR1 family protein